MAAPVPLVSGVPEAPHRILIVDDNTDSASIFAVLLEEFGHPVETAHTVADALLAARRFIPDIVFLDLRLPDQHGSELARRLRGERSLDGIRIYALTASSEEEDYRLAREAGCDALLLKPLDPSFLQSLLGKRHI